jgi:hemerythrin-like domain-containing protein
MRRDPALVSLSHDHHQALFVAMQLKRAGDEGAEEARAAFLDFWAGDGDEHFRREEEILFPPFAELAGADEPLMAQALSEHVAIRRLAEEVRDAAGAARLAELGDALSRHVRFEERTLFPLIEETLPAATLRRVADALAEAEGG